MTNEKVYEHQMKAAINEIKFQGTRLFARDEEDRFIFPDLEKVQNKESPKLENFPFNKGTVKYEKDYCYSLNAENIDIRSVSKKPNLVHKIPNENSKIVKIETTAHHIICELKYGYSERVIAISKDDGSEQSLSIFGNLLYQSICCVSGPYVIVTDNAHQMCVWKEEDKHFTRLMHPPFEVKFKTKMPIISGWGINASLTSSPNPPQIKCYRNWILFCYEGELSIWNIHNGEILTILKHSIKEV